MRSLVAASLLLASAVIFVLRTRLHWPLWPAYLAAINLTTFLAYLYDKRAAGHGRVRIPENLLHLLAALGGSPAALAGQLLLRHKTRK